MSVCVSAAVCVCVCVLVCAGYNSEPVDIVTSSLVWWYFLTISRSSSSIKSLGQGQGHPMENANLATWTSV